MTETIEKGLKQVIKAMIKVSICYIIIYTIAIFLFDNSFFTNFLRENNTHIIQLIMLFFSGFGFGMIFGTYLR